MKRTNVLDVGNDGNVVRLAGVALDAGEIDKIAGQIKARLRRTVEDIIATGRDLLAVKSAQEHGEFDKWISREFGWNIRTAQRYMLAARWAEGKSDTVSLLAPSTVYLLSRKSTPAAIGDAVIAKIEAGEGVDHRVVVAEVRAADRKAAKAEARKARHEPLDPKAERKARKEEEAVARHQAEAAKAEAERNTYAAELAAILIKLDQADLQRMFKIIINGEGKYSRSYSAFTLIREAFERLEDMRWSSSREARP